MLIVVHFVRSSWLGLFRAAAHDNDDDDVCKNVYNIFFVFIPSAIECHLILWVV